jgi:hypothetical protein
MPLYAPQTNNPAFHRMYMYRSSKCPVAEAGEGVRVGVEFRGERQIHEQGSAEGRIEEGSSGWSAELEEGTRRACREQGEHVVRVKEESSGRSAELRETHRACAKEETGGRALIGRKS